MKTQLSVLVITCTLIKQQLLRTLWQQTLLETEYDCICSPNEIRPYARGGGGTVVTVFPLLYKLSPLAISSYLSENEKFQEPHLLSEMLCRVWISLHLVANKTEMCPFLFLVPVILCQLYTLKRAL